MNKKITQSFKDPKVKHISIASFLDMFDYFINGIRASEKWNSRIIPQPDSTYFKITSNKLIAIVFGSKLSIVPFDYESKLETIYIADRDGHTEYEIYDTLINEAKTQRAKFKRNKKLDELIEAYEKAKRKLPKYKKPTLEQSFSLKFEDYLLDTGYKTSITDFKERYVVFDVETNGFRTKNDDLLSLSIYDPSTGICYNRYLPLDLQPVVLTYFVNGISEELLSDETHLDQNELNKIISYFKLNESTILSFSGGKGMFDPSFLINYCKRHNLSGIENLKFMNIKSLFPEAPFGSRGQLTKDNLCNMFGITGVEEVHSSMNDCVLEWKLFEKVYNKKLFCIQNNIYNFKDDYIVPASYASRYPELFEFAGVKAPMVLGYTEKIFEYDFPEKALAKIKKFPTNITGITIENAINHLLNVSKQDNSKFLTENRKKLEFIGSLDSNLIRIPITELDDGSIKSNDPVFNDYVKEINRVSKAIADNIDPVIKFLKTNIFKDQTIKSQEMVITDKKVLALCDLSDSNSVVEIKTNHVLTNDEFGEHIFESISQQMYFQQRGRSLYLLSVEFDKDPRFLVFGENINGLKFIVYKIDLKTKGPEYSSYQPSFMAKKVLRELTNDNTLTMAKLSEIIHLNPRTIQEYIKELKDHGAIEWEGSSAKTGVWRILIDENGKYVPRDKQLKYKSRHKENRVENS